MSAGIGFTLWNGYGEYMYFKTEAEYDKWLREHNYLPTPDNSNTKWPEWAEKGYGFIYLLYDETTNKIVTQWDTDGLVKYITDHPNNIIHTNPNASYYEIKDSDGNLVKDDDGNPFTSLYKYLQKYPKGLTTEGHKIFTYADDNSAAPFSLDVDDYEDLGDFFTSTEPYYDEAGNLIATPSPDTGNNESADGTPSADKDTDSLTPGGETPDSVDPSTGNGSSDQKEDSGFQPESGNGSTGNSGSGNDSSNPAEGTTDSGSSDTPVEDNNTDNTDSGSTDDSSDGGDFSSGDDSSSSGSGESNSGSDNGGDTSSSPESTDSSADASPEPQTPVE